MDNRKSKCDRSRQDRLSGRRDFLRQMGAGGLAAAGAAWFAGASKSAAQVAAPSTSEKAPLLPTIAIGGKTITRLITGGNPVQAVSQPTLHVQRHMAEYFTPERIADLLVHSEKVGINTFQVSYSDRVRDGLRLAWERGSKIQWICLTSDTQGAPPLETVLALKPIALAHHGGVTDRFFRQGKSDGIRDFINKVHDKGLLVGVSSHVPNNIRAVEEKDWGNDFFMTCFYNVVRTSEDTKREFGMVPVDNLYYLDGDPKIMTEAIRQSRKPCLAFKILAAGRLCWSPQSVEGAFQFAFRNIKPTDGVIVGMYPRFEDEPQANAALTRKYGAIG
jgi:hypothetical protein